MLPKKTWIGILISALLFIGNLILDAIDDSKKEDKKSPIDS